METNRIRQFCVVAEVENLRKASEILNITHGALSKSMQVLAKEVGIELFLKVGRGIALSEGGKSFHLKSIEFLSAVDKLMLKDYSKDDSISIGSFEVFSTHFFASVIADEFRNKKFRVQELLPGQLEQAIVNSKIDIGITYDLIPTQGVDALEITKCEMGLFGKKRLMSKHTIENVPFVAPIIPIKSTISGVKGLDGWPDNKLPRNRVYEVDMLETALQLSSQGKAVGFYPNFLVRYYNATLVKKYQLDSLPTPKEAQKIYRKVYILIKQGRSEDENIRKIARILRTCMKN